MITSPTSSARSSCTDALMLRIESPSTIASAASDRIHHFTSTPNSAFSAALAKEPNAVMRPGTSSA